MKKALLFIFLIISYFGFGQDVLMQNGTVTVCSGTFYDSGGESTNYSDNESFVMTICPDQPEARVKLEFSEFATQFNSDVMTIYDGDDTTASLLGVFDGSASINIIAASPDNLTGCLTVEFTSNGSGNTVGWAAEISCILPCQDIIAQIDSTVPGANPEGIIEICTGEDIIFNGSGIFEVDGTGATYIWDFGSGNTILGQSIDVSFNTPGVYFVRLEIRDTNTDNILGGCPNTNSTSLTIRVSDEPDFSATQAVDSSLCFGDSTTIIGVAEPTAIIYDCPPPESQITFLPDGSGVAYSTSINVTCFDPSQTLTDLNEIESICLNMEHSFLGDLDIEIISPNGQVVRLHDQGGGSANLGIPWATSTVDGQSSNTTPGIGYDYCFVANDAFPTLINGIQTGGVFSNGNGPNTYTDSYVPEGNYSSVNSLEDLLGSPLNGNWTIRIVDNLGADNGYIFSWELNFDNDLLLEDASFEPSIVSQSWDSDSSITQIDENTITVTPESAGQFCYTYRVVDSFGCEFTKEVCINVAEEGAAPVTYYEDLDGDGFGDPNSTIEDCSDTPPFGYAVNGLDCNDTNDLINPDAEDSEGNGVDENCDGVDGNSLGLDDFSVNDIKVLSNPFTDRLILNMPTILTGSQLNITIYDMNGRTMYNSIHSIIDGQIIIDNLNHLEKSTYFLELSNEEFGLNLVKKLMKI